MQSILGASTRPKVEFPTYGGSLIIEHLIDWMSELDKYFEYDEVEDDKKFMLVVAKLRGHASLWWDSVQAKRRRKNKPLIECWDIMVSNMRANFPPKDNDFSLYGEMKNLGQRLLIVREYTQGFYKVNLRAGYVEDTPKNTTRYINSLRLNIQD